MSKPPGSVADRFWPKVDKSGNCWLWTGATKGNGYGHMSMPPKRTAFVHRVSWELANGPIPPGIEVCHACDNPPCVRPEHLFLGTRADNAQDMGSKGRSGFTTHPETIRRGADWRAVHPKRPCIAGHPNTPENRDKLGRCIHCARRRCREYQRRRRGGV